MAISRATHIPECFFSVTIPVPSDTTFTYEFPSILLGIASSRRTYLGKRYPEVSGAAVNHRCPNRLTNLHRPDGQLVADEGRT